MTFCGALPLIVGGTHDLPLTHRMWQRGWDAAPMIMLLSTEFHLASRLAGLEEASCYEAHGPVGEGSLSRSCGQPLGADGGLQQETETLSPVTTRKYILPSSCPEGSWEQVFPQLSL